MNHHIRYELKELEKLTKEIFKLSNHDFPDPKSLQAMERQFENEVYEIKDRMVNQVINFSDKKHLQRFVQYHQVELVRLLDWSFKMLHDKNSNKDFFKQAYNSVACVMAFMESRFKRYFDQHAKLPDQEAQILEADVAHNVRQIREGLVFNHADAIIIDIVLSPFRRTSVAGEFTYHDVLYQKEFQGHLISMIANTPPANMNDALLALMVHLNINSHECFVFNRDAIVRAVSNYSSRTEVLHELSLRLKKISQYYVKDNWYLMVDTPSLSVQLVRFIQEEIAHLNRIDACSNIQVSAPGFKIQWDMSVAQVAFFIRLLTDSNVVINKNVAELLRFVTGVVVTKRSEMVSYDSFRLKYYNAEKGARETVRAVLQKMMSRIESIR